MDDSAPENTPKHGSVPPRAAYDARELTVLLGHGLRYIRTLIATGELASFKSGRLRKVSAADVDDYIARRRRAEQLARDSTEASA